jgi:flotillin
MVGAILFMMFIFICLWASHIVKVPPNMALIISGSVVRFVDPKTGRVRMRGYRIVAGGRAFIWPMLQKSDWISLEVFPVDLEEGTLLAKVQASESAISAAAEHYLTKSKEEMQKIVRELMDRHVRGIAPFGDPVARAQKIIEAAAPDLDRTGLEIVSLTVKS